LIQAVRKRFAAVWMHVCRALRPVGDRQLALWRLPVLAARLAENIEEERAALLAAIDAEPARHSR
jgi:hypothetical protein